MPSATQTKRTGMGAAVKNAKSEPKKGKPESAKGWFGVGWGTANAVVAKQEKDWADQKNAPRRFFLPKDGETQITFMDGEPYLIREHEFTPQKNGVPDYKNRVYKTCLADSGQHCPFCAAGNRASYVGLFTVIDHSEWKSSRDGKVYRNQLKVLVAKATTLKLLAKYAEKKGGDLSGWRFEVMRTGEKSPSVGDSFQFVSKMDLSKPQTWKTLGHDKPQKAIDFETAFAPMTPEEAKAWLSGAATASDEEGDEGVSY